jgi:vacuolar iron transporter family protein
VTTAHSRDLRDSGERHRYNTLGWLRASVLGANDGLISTASLLVGLSAADTTRSTLLKTGLAALVAGSLSMAAGEWVSVSAQSDAEQADIEKERAELLDNETGELHELAGIYRGRGLSHDLANQVAVAMHKHGALEAHLRDELSMTEHSMAKPFEAAFSSAIAFAAGALIAVLTAAAAPAKVRTITIALVTLVALAGLGIAGARLGDAKKRRAAVRVLVGGTVAMAVTALIGQLMGTTV